MEQAHILQPPFPDHHAPINDENAPPITADGVLPSPAAERWSRTVHPRGRQVRDPLLQRVAFQVNTMESMKTQLRDYLTNPTCDPEHTTIEFTFPTSAAFMVYTADFIGGKDAHKARSNIFNSLSRTAISVVDALSPGEPKDQMRKQKAIARTIIEAISETDGYRYSFHNNWLSKEDEASRFSYYCNDSTLNKGRAANEGAGMAGKRKVKPVYDCKGLIWVKFSVTKNNLEVHYKHVPIHKTYEERAPPPRKDSKRRKLLELFNPEKLPGLGRPGAKRKSTDDQGDKPRKRRATEPPRVDGDEPEPQDGSADREGARSADTGNDAPPIFPQEKIDQLKTVPKKPVKEKIPRPKKPQLPGMMSGYMSGNEIAWGERVARNKQPAPAQTPLEGIADAAAQVEEQQNNPAQGQMSELEMLKAKLAAAEARIHNLEAEKGNASGRTPSFGPPGWPPNPPPNQYSYPPPPQPSYYGGGQGQYQQGQAPVDGQGQVGGGGKGRKRGSGVNGQMA
jgi:hypothetical protein